MNKAIWVIVTFLAFLIGGYAIVQYVILDPKQAGLVQLKLMLGSKLSALWYIMLIIHAVSSVVALVIGPFSLSAKFREKNINRHRLLGKIYMVGILLGGISGVYLAFYATGGLMSKIGFGILAVLWLTSAYQALTKVKNNNISDHQKWMIRNYSLTFAAVTLRIWLPLFVVFFGPEHFELSYAIIAWLAWMPNLIIAEIFIKRNFTKSLNRIVADEHKKQM